MAENVAAQCLVRELLLSPAVCDLITSIKPDADAQDASPFPESSDHHEVSQHISNEALQLTLQTLLVQCQLRTCTSADITLAFKGLSDQSFVHLQVHRFVHHAQPICTLHP